MQELHRKWERFFYQHRDRGVRNLMLYIAIGNVLVYLVDLIDPSRALFRLLIFDADLILHRGQLWRLVSYVFVSGYSNPFSLVILMFLYYRIGQIMESRCGTLKFNCFYLAGIVIIDIVALITGWTPWIDTFHYSLMLAFATLCPDDRVLLFFLIPIRMKYLAWVYLGLTVWQVLHGNLFPLFAILNYLIFFGADIRSILPSFGGYHHVRTPREKKAKKPRAVPDPQWASHYHSKDGKQPYRHKCTVCGRTDTEYPDLEFRYCSRCNGYYCYCIDHINNHVHIQ